MRKLFSIELNEDTGQIQTTINCLSQEDIIAVCGIISEVCDEHKNFSVTLAHFRLESTLKGIENNLEKVSKNLEDVSEINDIDFNQILKDAKVDPNNHIKE